MTDNANNFRKTFMEFHANDEDEVEEIEMNYINKILNEVTDNEGGPAPIQLPRHKKCASHAQSGSYNRCWKSYGYTRFCERLLS